MQTKKMAITDMPTWTILSWIGSHDNVLINIFLIGFKPRKFERLFERLCILKLFFEMFECCPNYAPTEFQWHGPFGFNFSIHNLMKKKHTTATLEFHYILCHSQQLPCVVWARRPVDIQSSFSKLFQTWNSAYKAHFLTWIVCSRIYF